MFEIEYYEEENDKNIISILNLKKGDIFLIKNIKYMKLYNPTTCMDLQHYQIIDISPNVTVKRLYNIHELKNNINDEPLLTFNDVAIGQFFICNYGNFWQKLNDKQAVCISNNKYQPWGLINTWPTSENIEKIIPKIKTLKWVD